MPTPTTQSIRPDDPRITWAGAISLQRTDEWAMPWRLPYQVFALFPAQAMQDVAAMPSGVRISFRSDADRMAGVVVPDPTETRLAICCDGVLFGTGDLAGRDRFSFDGLPACDKLIEIWLPPEGNFRLCRLEIPAGAALARYDDPRPRWVTYGSSITHCSGVERPTETWPAIVARERGLNLTNLGFGGQCHLDVMYARVIRELRPDFISMCVGINIWGGGSLGPRAFQSSIIGFVKTIRDECPDVPFAVMSPIIAPPREETTNVVGFTLQAMRDDVAAAVAALQSRGDRRLHYVDGVRVMGPEQGYLLPDGVHPSDDGYKVMARRFLDEVVATVFVA